MIEILLQLMPLFMQFLKKDANERAEAVKMGEVMQRSAMKAEDWKGVLAGGLVQHIGRFTDEQQAIAESSLQGAIDIQAARQAAKGGGF